MNNVRLPAAVALLFVASVAIVYPAADAKPGVDWPSFRGIRASGVADGFPTAATWDIATKKGVRWSVPVPGLGHSSPVIWGNRLCITTAISGLKDAGLRIGPYGDVASVKDDTSHTWKLLCYDKTTGKTLVDHTVLSAVPKVKRHLKSTHASSTLATDGTRIIAMFGSEGLYAFDMNGKQLWMKDLGLLDSGWHVDPGAQWQFGSSPVIHQNVVILLADVQKNSFLAAFDATTGKELWRTPRADVPTWSTPTIHEVGGQAQILVNGWKHTGAYDFKTGKEIWKLNGLKSTGDIPVPTPIVGHGFVFFTNAHGGPSPILAIRETATGDISLAPNQTTNESIAWHAPREGAYLVSPVLYRGLLYVTKTVSAVSVFNAKTGERVHQTRIGPSTAAFTSSTIAADGKVYFTNEEGDVYVMKADTFEILATNSLGGISMATPAVSEGVLYFRTSTGLMAIK